MEDIIKPLIGYILMKTNRIIDQLEKKKVEDALSPKKSNTFMQNVMNSTEHMNDTVQSQLVSPNKKPASQMDW